MTKKLTDGELDSVSRRADPEEIRKVARSLSGIDDETARGMSQLADSLEKRLIRREAPTRIGKVLFARYGGREPDKHDYSKMVQIVIEQLESVGWENPDKPYSDFVPGQDFDDHGDPIEKTDGKIWKLPPPPVEGTLRGRKSTTSADPYLMEGEPTERDQRGMRVRDTVREIVNGIVESYLDPSDYERAVDQIMIETTGATFRFHHTPKGDRLTDEAMAELRKKLNEEPALGYYTHPFLGETGGSDRCAESIIRDGPDSPVICGLPRDHSIHEKVETDEIHEDDRLVFGNDNPGRHHFDDGHGGIDE